MARDSSGSQVPSAGIRKVKKRSLTQAGISYPRPSCLSPPPKTGSKASRITSESVRPFSCAAALILISINPGKRTAAVDPEKTFGRPRGFPTVSLLGRAKKKGPPSISGKVAPGAPIAVTLFNWRGQPLIIIVQYKLTHLLLSRKKRIVKIILSKGCSACPLEYLPRG